jgi:hypothetical protein
MARIRKTEPAVIVSATAAAPARRKAAAGTQKQAAASRKPGPSATVTQAAIVEPVAVAYSPKQEDIAALAYSYWVSRGCEGGSPEEDWLRAERELVG